MKSLLSTLALAVALALAACNGMAPEVFNQPTTLPGEVVLEMENGQTATLRITSQNPALTGFIKAMVGRGYYNDQYFYDQTPGSFVLVGKARLSGRPTVAGPYIKIDAKNQPDSAGTGEVGMVVHVDGTVGPELILRYGFMLRDRDLQPQNIAVGRITSGKSALGALHKGDKLTRAFFR
ncbi:MAG: hypothetical protein GC129_03955 [Proteobacteria bacterium]|nr:hypothetical protein [Pseudomonadota bacterium]